MLSIRPPRTRKSERGTRNSWAALRSAFRVSRSALDQESRRHRNHLRVPDERMREDPPQRAALKRDGIRRAGHPVEEIVGQALERPLDVAVLELLIPADLHPPGMAGRAAGRTDVPR